MKSYYNIYIYLLNIIILFLLLIFINRDQFNIIIDTYNIEEDKALVTFLKDGRMIDVIERVKINCDCIIIYEQDVSNSIRFKIFYIKDWSNVKNIDSKLEKYIKREIEIYYKKYFSEIKNDYKSALASVSLENILSRNELIKENEINKFNIKIAQSRGYVINMLNYKYIKQNYIINVNKYNDHYPSKQLKIIISIIFLLIIFLKINEILKINYEKKQ
jgi:hypothetical protein